MAFDQDGKSLTSSGLLSLRLLLRFYDPTFPSAYHTTDTLTSFVYDTRSASSSGIPRAQPTYAKGTLPSSSRIDFSPPGTLILRSKSHLKTLLRSTPSLTYQIRFLRTLRLKIVAHTGAIVEDRRRQVYIDHVRAEIRVARTLHPRAVSMPCLRSQQRRAIF